MKTENRKQGKNKPSRSNSVHLKNSSPLFLCNRLLPRIASSGPESRYLELPFSGRCVYFFDRRPNSVSKNPLDLRLPATIEPASGPPYCCRKPEFVSAYRDSGVNRDWVFDVVNARR